MENNKKKKNNLSSIILNIFGILLIIEVVFFNHIFGGNKPIGTISYSQYIQNIENGNIHSISIGSSDGLEQTFTVKTKNPIETIEYTDALNERNKFINNDNLTNIQKIYKYFNLYPSEKDINEYKDVFYTKAYRVVSDFSSQRLFEDIKINAKNVDVKVVQPSFLSSAISYIVVRILPTVLIFILILYFFTRMSESTGLLSDAINPSKTEIETDIKINDVVGLDEEIKLEVTEIIDFIKNPEKYQRLKSKSPKGILMVGKPGVGKTMLAKAIANEAGVDFFYKNASDLENPYVGMSSKSIKNLFSKAKKSKKAIIFIDEIDSIGSREKKHSGVMYDSNIINALLTAMDGFEENNGIIVIAATNYPEKLDKALLRAGRFDRQISIPLPNLKGRKEILSYYTKDKALASDVNLDLLAKLTTEYSGADLANLVNEASIQASRENQLVIKQEHFMKARDKKIMGVPFKNFQQSDKQKQITAVHEAGHAVLSYYLDKNNELYKVSILPRNNSLGVTVLVPIEENVNYNKTELNNMIKILFGGRIAEEIFFQEQTTGASNDFERANEIADKMIKVFGMGSESHNLQIIHVDNLIERKHSDYLLELVDKEKMALLNKNYQEAKEFLIKHEKHIQKLSDILIEKEEVDYLEIKQLFSDIDNEKNITDIKPSLC